MILEHFCSRTVLKDFMSTGYILGKYKYLNKDNRGIPNLFHSYTWMCMKMYELLPLPEISGGYPVWAWYTPPKKLNLYLNQKCEWMNNLTLEDLEWCNNVYTFISKYIENMNMVRITFDIPEEQILLSDFDNWHYVLNNFCYNRDGVFHEPSQAEKVYSWNHPNIIYPKDKYCLLPYFLNRSIQGTVWNISKDMVINIEYRYPEFYVMSENTLKVIMETWRYYHE